MGQEIEVRPGIVSKDSEGKLMCKPIFSKIVSLFAEHNDLQYAAPGGLIGKNILLLKYSFLHAYWKHLVSLNNEFECSKQKDYEQFQIIRICRKRWRDNMGVKIRYSINK